MTSKPAMSAILDWDDRASDVVFFLCVIFAWKYTDFSPIVSMSDGGNPYDRSHVCCQ